MNYNKNLCWILFSCATLLLNNNTIIEAAVEKTDQIEKSCCFFRDRIFVQYANVYSPEYIIGSDIQRSLFLPTSLALPIMKGEHFLEICCGTGVFSIFAALDGAEKVVAIDINPDAVENAIENSKKHEVSEKVTVLQGFMFSPLQKEQLFDVIFLNIPFLYRSCSDHLRTVDRKKNNFERELLCCYLKEGKSHIKRSGRMLLCYSTTRVEIEKMYQLAKEYGWEISLLQEESNLIYEDDSWGKENCINVGLYELRLVE